MDATTNYFLSIKLVKNPFFLNDANQLWILFEQKRLIAENDFDVLSDLLKMHRLMIKTVQCKKEFLDAILTKTDMNPKDELACLLRLCFSFQSFPMVYGDWRRVES